MYVYTLELSYQYLRYCPYMISGMSYNQGRRTNTHEYVRISAVQLVGDYYLLDRYN